MRGDLSLPCDGSSLAVRAAGPGYETGGMADSSPGSFPAAAAPGRGFEGRRCRPTFFRSGGLAGLEIEVGLSLA